MAFEKVRMKIDRGSTNDETGGLQVARHVYTHPTDTLAMIEAPGYFPPYLSADSESVKVGDLLDIVLANEGVVTYMLMSVSTVSISLANCSDLNTINFAGPWTGSPLVLPMIVDKTCKKVTLVISGAVQASSSAVAITAGPGSIPADKVPVLPVDAPIIVVHNSIPRVGRILVLIDGSITIYSDPNVAVFAGTGNEGFLNASISYKAAV